jgi:hypothetical protein
MKRSTTKDSKQTGGSSKRHHSDYEGHQHSKSGFAAASHASSAMGIFGKHQREKAVPPNPETRTAGKYLTYWLDNHAAPRCQPKTLERYGQLADNLTRLLGGVSLLDLTPAIIQDVINVMHLRWRCPNQGSSGRTATGRQNSPRNGMGVVHLSWRRRAP